MVTPLVRSSYVKLLKEIRLALGRGRERARQAVEKEKAGTYWEVGRLINADLRIHDGRAGYGMRLIPHLASDLGVSDRLLWKIVHFQETFPILPTRRQNLEWSHFEILSSIEDRRQRKTFYEKALRQDFNTRELVAELKKHKVIVSQEGKAILKLPTEGMKLKPLKPRRGVLYTYRIVKPRDLHERPDFYSIDLGFKNRIDWKLSGLGDLREGTVLEVLRTVGWAPGLPGGLSRSTRPGFRPRASGRAERGPLTEKQMRGDRYRFRKSNAGTQALYTYKAQVQTVIDGDTLWAYVDLGFRVWTQRKLRLRGLNAAEMGDGGKRAAAYIQKVLSRVAFVVVKLSGRDKFDRYLTDLFYLEGEADSQLGPGRVPPAGAAKSLLRLRSLDPKEVLEKGKFLNQELIDRGLAKRV